MVSTLIKENTIKDMTAYLLPQHFGRPMAEEGN